ncbi:Signal recognition particle protein [Candidatus Brocadiaceae bacterium B188]|nr:signal recognition particle protein [Candidatus Brocadia sapporoensis]RZV56680.1 MAG: signal recognition particle protein [Candidatus Brocadia sp. BROELEC01]TWU54267.1 Signal recognition particle protein [Candidatus Brocadiaceae bacterium B188]
MFESIANSLEGVLGKFRGKGRLTESNIKDGLHEVRLALLEADVNYKVVKDFIQHVTERAVGEEVIKSIAPGQQIVKIVHDELIKLMGESDTAIPFRDGEPTMIMLVGLQGSGKTTTAGKLAKTILSKGRKPLLVAADIQRPAAIEQLKILGQQLNVPVYFEPASQPVKICKDAVAYARTNIHDVVIFDTAGRLHIDDDLMLELREIKQKLEPHQIYFVCDSMTGQDAVNSAKEFNTRLGFDGVILTKLDGDTRGGAALSIRSVVGKPIKFVGIGEKLDRLEEFHPDRMASRILGMGDVVSLVERAQQAFDMEEAQKLSRKIQNDTLGLDDFLLQLQQIKKMGPLKEVLGMIPGLGNKMDGLNVDEKQLQRVEAIIRSMTIEERTSPDMVNGSRRQRVANGSGTTIQDVNQLLKQFRAMKKMMRHFKGNERGLKKGGLLSKGLPFGKGMIR